jgi:hypothetical protein
MKRRRQEIPTFAQLAGRLRVDFAVPGSLQQMALEKPILGIHADSRRTANLGHQVGGGTVANILQGNGTEPLPERDAHTPMAEVSEGSLAIRTRRRHHSSS